MGSTIFFIVGGFGGCTGLEDSAPTVFSVVLSWLGGFFCSGFFSGGFTIFSDMLWWLGGFLCAFVAGRFFLRCCGVFSAFHGACFADIGFFCFLEVIRD
jgi:hypothetical protein